MTHAGERPEAVGFTTADYDRVMGYWQAHDAYRITLAPLDQVESEQEMVAYCRQLEREGPVGARVFLAALRALEIDEDVGVDALGICATEENAAEIMAFIAEQPRRQSNDFAKVVARVATPAVLPHVEQYLRGGTPLDSEQRLEQALGIAFAGLARAEDPEERTMWQAAVDRWQRQIRLTYEPAELEALAREYHPDRLALIRAQRLFVNGTDPVYGPSSRLNDVSTTYPRADRPNVIPKLFDLAARYGSPVAATAAREISQEIVAREAGAPTAGVSIGLEIEVKDGMLLRRRPIGSPTEVAGRMVTLLAGYRLAEAAGVPAGKDHLWEFAHQPAYYPSTLVHEVALLRRCGLLDTAEHEYPLHLSIGNITTLHNLGRQAHLLIRLLEATGWATSAGRFRRLETDIGEDWVGDTLTGIRNRQTDEIVGYVRYVTEGKAFCLRSLVGLAQLLRSSYGLGSALAAYQREKLGPGMTPRGRALSAAWEACSAEANRHFKTYLFDGPAERRWQASKPGKTVTMTGLQLDPNFSRLASMLEIAEANSASAAAHFVAGVQDLTERHTDKALAVLYS